MAGRKARSFEPHPAMLFGIGLVLGAAAVVLLRLPMLRKPKENPSAFLHWLSDDFAYRDSSDDESPVLRSRSTLSSRDPSAQLERLRGHMVNTRNVPFSSHDNDEGDASNAISESDTYEDSLWKRMQRTAREAGWENTDGDPKIALLFLTRGPIPHDHLWERFISENPSLVSVYIHPAPGFKYNSTTTRAPSFYDRQIPSTPVQWGNASIVNAERRLLAAALSDRNNERFVLLSESCIPVRNLTFVHHYLFADNWKSYLDSFLDVQNRYHTHLAPTISVESWRKGSQWFVLNREHAHLVVNDDLYYETLRKYCNVDCPRGQMVACRRFCAPDERALHSGSVRHFRSRERDPSPQHTFCKLVASDASPSKEASASWWVVQEASRELLRDIQARTEVWRPLEKEQLQCGRMPSLNGNGTVARPCHLFARKFSPRAGKRIATFASEVLGLPEVQEQRFMSQESRQVLS